MKAARSRIPFLLGILLLVAGAGHSQVKPTSEKPDLYVLSIGIRKYQNYGRPNTHFADKDAVDFDNVMKRSAGKRFSHVYATPPLLNEHATRSAIADAIKEIIAKARAQDTFVFFFSGHGKSVADGKRKSTQFYLAPGDFDGSRDDIVEKGISAAQLQYWFIRIACEHQFVALDSSRSDRGFEDFKNNIDRENKMLAGLARRDIVILAVKNSTFEFESLRNGLLTYVLVRGLEGGAARRNGDIAANRLVSYVNSEMKLVLKNLSPRERRKVMKYPNSWPLVYTSGEDFVLGGVQVRGDVSISPGPNRYVSFIVPNSEPPTPFSETAITGPREHSSTSPGEQCEYTTRTSTSNSNRKGKDFALLIAVNEYKYWDSLASPLFDAEALADILHDRYDFEVEVLKNPTKACIHDTLLDRYAKPEKYGPDSQLFVFFTGHGVYLNPPIDTGFVVLTESKEPDQDKDGQTYFSHPILRRMIDGLPCEHILLVMDACQSGSMDESPSRKEIEAGRSECNLDNLPDGDTDEAVAARLLACKTRVILTSGDKEYVPDGGRNNGSPLHSPFAAQFLEALEGGNGTRFVLFNEVFSQMLRRAPKILPRRVPWPPGDNGRDDFIFFKH